MRGKYNKAYKADTIGVLAAGDGRKLIDLQWWIFRLSIGARRRSIHFRTFLCELLQHNARHRLICFIREVHGHNNNAPIVAWLDKEPLIGARLDSHERQRPPSPVLTALQRIVDRRRQEISTKTTNLLQKQFFLIWRFIQVKSDGKVVPVVWGRCHIGIDIFQNLIAVKVLLLRYVCRMQRQALMKISYIRNKIEY